jgi:hypothetical protein
VEVKGPLYTSLLAEKTNKLAVEGIDLQGYAFPPLFEYNQ